MISMKNTFQLFLTTATLVGLTACGNNPSSEVDSAMAAESSTTLSTKFQTAMSLSVNAFRPPVNELVTETPMKARDLTAAPTAINISLGAPLPSQTVTARKNNQTVSEDNMGKPLQIGFGRDVAQTATAAATKQLLNWKTTNSGGQVAAINFNSTGAKGMRVGFLISQLPETATLRFYAKDATTAFEVKGSEVLAVLAKNLAAGDKTDSGRTYWTPDIDGANATVEIEIPFGIPASSVVISMPNISHIFMSSKDINSAAAQINYTGDTNAGLSCQVDVTCTSPRPAATDAVAHIRFNEGASTYICSGTMLNDNINSTTPYLLTANHCISSQTVASTMQAWFKYRSTTCNDGTSGEYYTMANNFAGADLLYTAYGTDSTLLKLRSVPNVAGILYAGWDATTAPTVATSVHSIHHPKGDQQRLSRGTITSYSIRDATNENSFWNSNVASGTILDVTVSTGLTEGGSSGSGLFKGTDANPQVIGQLYGGSAPACGAPKYNVYGRFDVAYNAGMSDWLTQGVKTVSQLYNASTGVHYYTIGVTDANNVTSSNPAYSNQGGSFKASTVPAVGLSPVYRFFNTNNSTYFYTISEKERAAVASNTPRMRFDGIVWYANATSVVGTVPLYRALNTITGAQFYTANSAARTSFIAANPQFKTDGIAYYVQP